MNQREPPATASRPCITIEDFYAYMPTHEYIFAPTGALWPAASVNAQCPKVPLLNADGTAQTDDEGKVKALKASTWLDHNRPIQAMIWAPGEDEVIHDRLPRRGGWHKKLGVHVYNTYERPELRRGHASGSKRWQDLLERLYPNDVGHLTAYWAHCIQRPGVKINHGVVLAGPPRIGKDTLIEPLRRGVGEANFAETSPYAMLKEPYNDYLCAVVLRVSEARDQGDVNRYALYEKMKTMLAAPPPIHPIRKMYVPHYYALNVVAVIITTNYGFDALYLPADDGRHYVAATEVVRASFLDGFFEEYYHWHEHGGAEDVVAYLAEYDLRGFNPKAPPEKTPAFRAMANASVPAEVSELIDLIERAGRVEKPPVTRPAVLTLAMLRAETGANDDLREWLADRKNRRVIPHRLAACGYVPVPNPDSEEGLWCIGNVRQIVYGRRDQTPQMRHAAAVAVKARIEQTAPTVTPFRKRREELPPLPSKD